MLKDSPRLADVARQAGVSIITASRALRRPDMVAPETRARIDAAVKALNYVPNRVAGALSSARSRTVAVLVPTISASSLFAETINGLTDSVAAQGYSILLAQSGYDPLRQEEALAALLGHRPEAVVMVGSPLTRRAREMLERAANGGVPVVEIWELPARPIGATVGFDHAAVGAVVAEYFAGRGRRKLAFAGSLDTRAKARWRGFQAATKKIGLPPPLRIILPAPATMDAAAAACGRSGADGGLADVDAVFAANDVFAAGLLSGFREMGRSIPGEVAVVGLGNLELARHVTPPLTTIGH